MPGCNNPGITLCCCSKNNKYWMRKRPPSIQKIWNAYRFIREIRGRPSHKDYAWASQLPLDWDSYREFETYVLAEVGLPPTETHRLCRKDRSQGWVVDNLVWRTPRDLARTQAKVINKTYQKRTRMITEWSEVSGINYATMLGRLRRGWPIRLAISIPPDERFNRWRKTNA